MATRGSSLADCGSRQARLLARADIMTAAHPGILCQILVDMRILERGSPCRICRSWSLDYPTKPISLGSVVPTTLGVVRTSWKRRVGRSYKYCAVPEVVHFLIVRCPVAVGLVQVSNSESCDLSWYFLECGSPCSSLTADGVVIYPPRPMALRSVVPITRVAQCTSLRWRVSRSCKFCAVHDVVQIVSVRSQVDLLAIGLKHPFAFRIVFDYRVMQVS
jgi:hypothetical protein